MNSEKYSLGEELRRFMNETKNNQAEFTNVDCSNQRLFIYPQKVHQNFCQSSQNLFRRAYFYYFSHETKIFIFYVFFLYLNYIHRENINTKKFH
jgi:hypothetical protein